MFMKKVIFRTIEKNYPQVHNLICTSFGLCSSLAEQTYNLVAEPDGRVVGVIMGASDHAKHTAANIINGLQSRYIVQNCAVSTDDRGMGQLYRKYFLCIRLVGIGVLAPALILYRNLLNSLIIFSLELCAFLL